MKDIIFLVALIMGSAYELEATAPYCYDVNTGASAAVGGLTPTAGTHCEYTHAYGPSGTWRATMWPTSTYVTTAVTSLCTATTQRTCKIAVAAPATAAAVTDLPPVSSCYLGTALTADTLTNQATTTCASTSYFCKAAFTGTGTSTTVSLTCDSSTTNCVNSATQLCSMVANTNQVLGCYVGQKVTTGTATIAWAKNICAPIGTGSSAASASYCQLDYRWSATWGYYIDGSCVSTCIVVPIVQTGTIATVGTTCTATIYGNSLAVRNFSFTNSLIIMVVSCIMSVFVF